MNKYSYLLLLLFLSNLFQSCNEENEINQIKTYKDKEISFKKLEQFLELGIN